MISKYIDMQKEKNYTILQDVAQAIKDGELVIFPTETVYGIGANALEKEASKKIYSAKGRASDNPLIVHISKIEMLQELVEEVNEIENKLIENFWPGPFTIIFKAKEIIPRETLGGLDTVAIRMPDNIIAKKLIDYSNLPIAAPSANISGRPSGTKIEDIIQEFDGKVKYIIDGGSSNIGLESTVVRVIDNKVRILRPGKVSKKDIEELGIPVEIDKNVISQVEKEEKVLSPGMKYRHYAPNTKCMMIYSKNKQKMISKINEVSEKQKTLIICRNKNENLYNSNDKILIGDTKEEFAHNIFSALRKVDKYDVDLVIIEGVDKEGIGLAIFNRLIRACEYNYLEL